MHHDGAVQSLGPVLLRLSSGGNPFGLDSLDKKHLVNDYGTFPNADLETVPPAIGVDPWYLQSKSQKLLKRCGVHLGKHWP